MQLIAGASLLTLILSTALCAQIPPPPTGSIEPPPLEESAPPPPEEEPAAGDDGAKRCRDRLGQRLLRRRAAMKPKARKATARVESRRCGKLTRRENRANFRAALKQLNRRIRASRKGR